MILEFSRVRASARTPVRANPSDAGLDIFYCPETPKSVVLRTNENKILPTGLKFGVPHGYMLQVMNRSSVAAKNNLVVGAHCIDSGYEGEVFIDLHNIGLVEKVIKPGEKIAQLVLVPVVPFRVTENVEGTLYDNVPITISGRGEGALGSTNSKTSRFDGTANADVRDHYSTTSTQLTADMRSVAAELRREAEQEETTLVNEGLASEAKLDEEKNHPLNDCPVSGF